MTLVRTTRALAGAAVLAVALLVAGCGSSGSGSGSGSGSTSGGAATTDPGVGHDLARTLRFKSQLSAAPRERNAQPGAQMVFTGMLFKPKGGSAIGRSQGACTRTATGRGAVFQCLLSFVLHDGVIYAQSIASLDGPADGVVTGGTESYAGVRGTFDFKATGNPRVDLTFRLAGSS